MEYVPRTLRSGLEIDSSARRSDKLYENYKIKEARLRELRQRAADEVEAEFRRECTFQPRARTSSQPPSRSASSGGRSGDGNPSEPSNAVMARLTNDRRSFFEELARRHALATMVECPFVPAVNHNLDEQLNAWSQGFSATERLYGLALHKQDEAFQREEAKRQAAARRQQEEMARKQRIQEEYERALDDLRQRGDESKAASSTSPSPSRSFVNGDTSLESSKRKQWYGRYLEDPREKEVRMERLRQKYAERHSFSPSVPRERSVTSPSVVVINETLTARTRRELAERKQRLDLLLEKGPRSILESESYRQRRDELLQRRSITELQVGLAAYVKDMEHSSGSEFVRGAATTSTGGNVDKSSRNAPVRRASPASRRNDSYLRSLALDDTNLARTNQKAPPIDSRLSGGTQARKTSKHSDPLSNRFVPLLPVEEPAVFTPDMEAAVVQGEDFKPAPLNRLAVVPPSPQSYLTRNQRNAIRRSSPTAVDTAAPARATRTASADANRVVKQRSSSEFQRHLQRMEYSRQLKREAEQKGSRHVSPAVLQRIKKVETLNGSLVTAVEEFSTLAEHQRQSEAKQALSVVSPVKTNSCDGPEESRLRRGVEVSATPFSIPSRKVIISPQLSE